MVTAGWNYLMLIHHQTDDAVEIWRGLLDAKAQGKIDAFAATTTANGGWVRG